MFCASASLGDGLGLLSCLRPQMHRQREAVLSSWNADSTVER